MKKHSYILILIIATILLCCACTYNKENKEQSNLLKNNVTDNIVTQNNVPTEYSEVIDEYKRLLAFRFSDDFYKDNEEGIFFVPNENFEQNLEKEIISETGDKQKLGVHWSYMIAEMDSLLETKGTPEAFGYILKDINEDSIKELFWVDKNHNILALFTIVDGKAELLDAYWPRHQIVLTNNGAIYSRSSSGAAYIDYQINELADNSSEFVQIKSFGVNGRNASNNSLQYYQNIDETTTLINETTFDDLLKEYPFENSNDWLNTPITFFENSYFKQEANSKASSLYLIEETNENIISFQIPTIEELEEQDIDFIKNFIIQKLNVITGEKFELQLSKKDIQNKKADYSEYYIEVKSTISFISDDLISIVFEGFYNYKSAAHPTNLLFSLNYNPQTMDTIAFTDKYIVDEALYKVFTKMAESNIKNECDGVCRKVGELFLKQYVRKNVL